jgi:hypothetical protein
MNRLQSELQRLYLLPSNLPTEPGPWAGSAGEVRALVLELARPADWDALSRVWRGVQADLALPAPAIAVSGTDGLQLWFSLQAPLDADRGAEFLAGLRARYLADVSPARLRLTPPAAGPAPVPEAQPSTGNWSAFVAADLAPVFVDTPWLDIQPGVEGQADLLARLQGIKPAALDAAMQCLRPAGTDVPPEAHKAPAAGETADVDPRRFLQHVLNDETVALALRIEAAKALLR